MRSDVINRQGMIDFFLDVGMVTAALYVQNFPAETDMISRKMSIKEFKPYAEYESNMTNKEWVRRTKIVLSNLPSTETALHYCRDCKWSRCYNNDKHGKTESYWWCLNWDAGTYEGGYCHEWKRRSND